jgi:hypothetical protein
MFTENILRNNPSCVKAFTGIPANEFWAWLEQMEAAMPAYEEQRLNRTDCQRAGRCGTEFRSAACGAGHRRVDVFAFACAANRGRFDVRFDAIRYFARLAVCCLCSEPAYPVPQSGKRSKRINHRVTWRRSHSNN